MRKGKKIWQDVYIFLQIGRIIVICIFAGSFDPVTIGHVDIIRRGAAKSEKLYVAVMHNVRKNYMFSVEKRVEMLKKALAHIENIEVECYGGLLIDYAREKHADFVLRGVRNTVDFEFERDMASANMRVGGVETLALFTRPEYSGISSSFVRELLQFGADPSQFVPKEIIDDLLDGR